MVAVLAEKEGRGFFDNIWGCAFTGHDFAFFWRIKSSARNDKIDEIEVLQRAGGVRQESQSMVLRFDLI
jgi:hypothetical protein